MHKIVICLFCLCVTGYVYGQNKKLAIVLKTNKIGKTFCFDDSKIENDYYKTYIKYLGVIKSDKNVKIVSLSTEWGDNKHSSAFIYLFEISNKYIGRYALGDKYDLPKSIKNNNLIFIKNDDSCKAKTMINFSKGIPKNIFIFCNGKYGDMYSLTKD